MVLDKAWKLASKDYKIVELIGEGSEGQVVRAKNRNTKEIVAIKMINCNIKETVVMKYLIREIQILR
jgi:serine/threonine protein kinase